MRKLMHFAVTVISTGPQEKADISDDGCVMLIIGSIFTKIIIDILS